MRIIPPSIWVTLQIKLLLRVPKISRHSYKNDTPKLALILITTHMTLKRCRGAIPWLLAPQARHRVLTSAKDGSGWQGLLSSLRVLEGFMSGFTRPI